jgi:hypothetical protein
MKGFVHKTLLPGLRCLVIVCMLMTFGLSTWAAAMGFEQVLQTRKAQIEPAATALDQIGAAQSAGDAGKMTPKPKSTAGREITVIASVGPRVDSDGGRFNRYFTCDCTTHQVNPYRSQYATILPSLALTAPALAQSCTLVGARPSGTM